MKAFSRIIIVVVVIAGGILGYGMINKTVFRGEKAGECVEEHHDEHGGKCIEEHHDEHGEEGVVSLKSADIEIKTEAASSGNLNLFIDLPGEIALNQDKIVHILPRVPGVVKEVRKVVGNRVRIGEVLAVLESRELADLKAAYFSAREMLSLAELNFNREQELWEKKITAQQEYLDAKQQLEKARIELRSSEQKLHALGFSEEDLSGLSIGHDTSYTRYAVIAPSDGIIIEKHISVGEMAKEEDALYLIANLNTVWIDFKVHERDLPYINMGTDILISVENNMLRGRISYLSPIVQEQSRTAIARTVISNPQERLKPGLFVTGRVAAKEKSVPIAIPLRALQKKDKDTIVFIQQENSKEFMVREVATGLQDNELIEITSGIQKGERVVVEGNFYLFSELKKEGLEDPCGGH